MATAWRYPCIEFIIFQHNASIIAYFSPNVKKSFKLLCVENAKPQILPFVYRRFCKKDCLVTFVRAVLIY